MIIAAVFWTWLWGPIGLLLSTPLTACLLVLGRHVPQLTFLEVMLGSDPVLTPDETFYQRLLAGDPEEATEQAEEFAKEKSLDEFAQEVALPVLVRAQADSDRGILPPERRSTIKDGFARILENLFDDSVIDPDAAPETGARPADSGFVVCLAGRNELDEAAAMLLASLLRARGHHAYVFQPDSPAALGGHRVALRDAAAVCLSLISTSSAARARHIVRRLRRRAPRARIVVGFWGLGGGDAPAADTLAVTSADAIATTLDEAIAEIEARLTALPAAQDAPPDLRDPGSGRLIAIEPATQCLRDAESRRVQRDRDQRAGKDQVLALDAQQIVRRAEGGQHEREFADLRQARRDGQCGRRRISGDAHDRKGGDRLAEQDHREHGQHLIGVPDRECRDRTASRPTEKTARQTHLRAAWPARRPCGCDRSR